jgi:ABC-type transport system involved in multi-copper enzyme maturation permease subunit
MQYWALMVDSFRESRDRKIFWVMLAVSVFAAGAMLCVGFEPGKITFLWMWEYQTKHFTTANGIQESLITGIVVDGIMGTILGQVGIILVIVATAGFFPAWMERGAIDVVVSKPMARWKLFLGRYLGTMAFILFHAAVFVVLTFLVAGFRWGVWIPGYLLAIPLVVLLFSYLYCVSVLVAVVFRNTVAAVLLTLGAWMSFASIQTTDDMFAVYPEWQEYKTVYQAVHLARWIVPNTQDIIYTAKKWSGAAGSAELVPDSLQKDPEMIERADRVEMDRTAISPAYTIGSSLLFEAVLVMIAMWKFSRRDF